MIEAEEIGLRVRVEELETEVEELNARVAGLERILTEMRALGEDFWREEAALFLIGANTRGWRYDARDRNVLFNDVFPAEQISDNHWKRWVGKSGELTASVAINRTAPLLFTVVVDGFVARELAKTLNLEVDGERIAWSDQEKKTWSAVLPEQPGRVRLNFRLSVDSALVPPNKDVTFSFCEISLAPAPAGQSAPQKQRLLQELGLESE
jgi:hypothetical protein